MIRKVIRPRVSTDTPEGIKIAEMYAVYGDIALFWHMSGGKAVISLLDGDMIIYGKPTDYAELSAFIGAVSPRSIFASAEILKGLSLYDSSLIVSVLSTDKVYSRDLKPDFLTSDDVYALLSKGRFDLPEFQYFAPDFCLRRNHKRLHCFGFKDRAVAICIGRKNVLINGLVSLEKGCGSVCLSGLLAEVKPEKAFVCAKPDVEEFYIKNGFTLQYAAGYWRQ